MLDQSFSAENFRGIYDRENRKGNNPYKFIKSDEIEGMRESRKELIKERKKTYNEFKHSGRKNELLKERLEEQEEAIKSYDEKIESFISNKLQTISNEVNRNFSFSLIKIEQSNPDAKDIFSIADDAKSFFASKQLQSNIKKLYKVAPANRHLIVGQIKALLSDNFPKRIFRFDIEKFYESIDGEKLLAKIERDSLLSPQSKKLLISILESYWNIIGSRVGIPRGVGISAYLAEIYMRDFDDAIKSIPYVIFFARYVDDICVITSSDNSSTHFYRKAKAIIKSEKLVFSSNPDKMFKCKCEKKSKYQFDYLGYKFDRNEKLLAVKLSSKRFERYKDKIKSSFESFSGAHKTDLRKARNLLLKRIKFLTGNTKLYHSKNKILTGIYYNNLHLENDYSQLEELDSFLLYELKKFPVLLIHDFNKRLLECSFTKGYKEKDKHFRLFKIVEFKKILKAWRE